MGFYTKCADCGKPFGLSFSDKMRCASCQENRRKQFLDMTPGNAFACVTPYVEPLDPAEANLSGNSLGLTRPITRKAVGKVRDGVLSVTSETRAGVFNVMELPTNKVRKAVCGPNPVWLQLWPAALKGLVFLGALSTLIVIVVTVQTGARFLAVGVLLILAAALVGGLLGLLIRAPWIQRESLLFSLHHDQGILAFYVQKVNRDYVVGILKRAGISEIEVS